MGTPGDKYEVEADRMADQVVNKTSGDGAVQKMEGEEEVQQKPLADAITSIQRMELAEEEPVQAMEEEEPVQAMEEEEPVQAMEEEEAKCAECEKEGVQKMEEEEPVQTKANSPSKISGKTETSLKNSHGGTPMDAQTKAEMEHGFGADFSHINIHNDSKAAQMSQDINAQAFTYGNDIYFNQGKYDPNSSKGKHLLAHELTHTIQQKGMVQQKVQRRLGDGHDFPTTSNFSRNHILESTYDNFRTVKSGNNGTHVTLVQQALVNLGYPLPRFGVDGSFGDETQRAVKAFQEDVGITVDGIVGTNTIDFLDKRSRGTDVAPPTTPVVANIPLNPDNVIAQPGATPSIALGAGDWGLTFPENVQVRIDVFDNGGVWQPVLTGVTGNYSLQTRLLPGVTEVTGPGGNTTAANYCNQINDLNSLTLVRGAWFMDAAVVAHERVHAEKFRDALVHPFVLNLLEAAIEAITIPRSLLIANPTMAELFIRSDPRFQAALNSAQANWLAQILIFVNGDHGTPVGSGPTYTAEREILDPMIRRICNHARANGFAACAPLCP